MTDTFPRDPIYLVALDPRQEFCRLFRADSVEAVGLTPLWTGGGLRAGYDAMIRLNKDRRPTDLFLVCRRQGTKGRASFRLYRTAPPADGGWDVLSSHPTHADARKEVSRLVAERSDAEAAERDRILRTLERLGVRATRMPRLTAADRRYLDWLEARDRPAA